MLHRKSPTRLPPLSAGLMRAEAHRTPGVGLQASVRVRGLQYVSLLGHPRLEPPSAMSPNLVVRQTRQTRGVLRKCGSHRAGPALLGPDTLDNN
jgi:hypothetical protein